MSYTLQEGKDKTGYKILYGCHGFTHVPKADQGKMDPRSRPCLYLGPSTRLNRFRLWDPRRNKFFECSSALFNDLVLGAKAFLQRFGTSPADKGPPSAIEEDKEDPSVLLWEEGPMPLIQPDPDVVIQDHLIIPNVIGNLPAVEISLSPQEHLGDGAGPPETSMKMSGGAE